MLRKIVVKTLFPCLVSAILLILSFPNFSIWLFAWFAFVPVFFALKNKTLKESFLLFFITGLIFWAGTIYWLAHVTLPGTAILILYLSLYFAVFGLIIRPFTRQSTPFTLLFIPAVWVLLEYIRGFLFTGFPWALLGYSQYLNLPAIQIASITGAWGVSFLVMFVNVSIVEIIWSWKNKKWPKLKPAIISLSLLLFLTLGYGIYSLRIVRVTGHKTQDTRCAMLKISVIQGNIPQELKWDQEYAKFIAGRYAALTKQAAIDKPDLIIWPEASIPGILGENDFIYQDISSLVESIKIPLLSGAVVYDQGKYFGSALLFSASGEIIGRYDKLHLVPFGEYIPLRNALPFLQTIVPIGEISRGKEYTIFDGVKVSGCQSVIRFAVLDCFEDVFPALSREFVKRGAGFLVNITNDAWYKKTSAPYQHLQASVFRALENRVYLARAANTGISGFISPTGKIISLVQDAAGKETFITGFDTKEIPLQDNPGSFYTKFGDFFIPACILIIFYGIIFKIRKKKNSKR